MYKTAFLGCGGRARAHADAYRFVKRGKIGAICDMNEELLNSFGTTLGFHPATPTWMRCLKRKNRMFCILSRHRCYGVPISGFGIR